MARPDVGPLVEAEGVTVRFRGREVLTAAGLTVGRGEIVTLIGPNGAGKTTLLRVVLGLLAPGGGTVRLAPGLRVGYMPQRLTVDPSLPLSVQRFLELAGRDVRKRLRPVLEEVGASATLGTPIQGVSGGEMQRVLLARALLRDPDLLVLDEPVQGVDVQGQVELFDLIARLRDERGCGVLMVSHDLHLVMARTDRVVCLNRTVCCTGAPALVTREPAYLTLFRGAVSSGLAPYAHAHAADRACGPAAEGESGEGARRG